jgi:branched-chain amino acid transport system permease protein
MTAKIPNFAHGTYAGYGVYVVWTFARVWEMNPYIGFPVALLLGGLIGVLLYTVVVSTLRRMGGGAIVLTIATIALGIFLEQGLHIYAYWIRETRGLMSYGFLLKQNDFEFFGFQGIFPVALILCAAVVIFLHRTLTGTNFGIAMRATAEDPTLAAVLGINTNRIQMVSWAMTGGMAALAGAMLPMWFMGGPTAGVSLLVSCMAGSLLGGLDNIYGAVIGGFTVGLVEIILTSNLQTWFGLWVGEYRPLVPMILTIVVLLIEPDGISGYIERMRVQKTGPLWLRKILRTE